MWFGYNPQIIFYHFFCYFNLGIFLAFLLSKLMDTGYLVCATPPTVLCRFLMAGDINSLNLLVSNYAPGAKNGPAPGSHVLHRLRPNK